MAENILWGITSHQSWSWSSRLCITCPLCRESTSHGGFPAQRASNGESMSISWVHIMMPTVYPKKYAHGFSFAVLCCGYTLTDFPISIRLTSLALWQSNDCPSASKATLMNMDKCFMWIHYERLHNHNKAKHNKTVCMFLGIYCMNFSNAPCMQSFQSVSPVCSEAGTTLSSNKSQGCCQWEAKCLLGRLQ